MDETTGLIWRLAAHPPALFVFNPQSEENMVRRLRGFGNYLMDSEDYGTGYEIIINPRANNSWLTG